METKENIGWRDCRDLRWELLFERDHRIKKMQNFISKNPLLIDIISKSDKIYNFSLTGLPG
jgi:hypothetical protein